MEQKLELMLADGIVDQVLGRLKSGKEAELWLVDHGGEVIAAKIYKDRQTRSFRNNAAYKEGRVVANSRTQRAIKRRSAFGQAAEEEAWKSAEADALYKLHAHGVRVPTPVMFYEGVLLMQLVVDAEGQPAPRLIDVDLPAELAAEFYADLRTQMIRMLELDMIHGDLSPYNVLVGAVGPTIIDFPQIIAAAHNSSSERFFARDLENIRLHLAAFDSGLEARAGDAAEIWHAYTRRELTADFVPTGKAPPSRRSRYSARRDQRGPRHQQGASGDQGRASNQGPGPASGGQPPREQQHARPESPPPRPGPGDHGEARGRSPHRDGARPAPRHVQVDRRPSQTTSDQRGGERGGNQARPDARGQRFEGSRPDPRQDSRGRSFERPGPDGAPEPRARQTERNHREERPDRRARFERGPREARPDQRPQPGRTGAPESRENGAPPPRFGRETRPTGGGSVAPGARPEQPRRSDGDRPRRDNRPATDFRPSTGRPGEAGSGPRGRPRRSAPIVERVMRPSPVGQRTDLAQPGREPQRDADRPGAAPQQPRRGGGRRFS